MLLDLVKTAWKPLIFVALVSLMLSWAFNIPNTMLTTQTIQIGTMKAVTIKTFDLQKYLQNVSNAWSSTAINFEDIIPTRQWQQVSGSVVDSSFWNSLFNNLALLFDWCYFPFNLVLWLTRIGAWLLTILLSIIGWNTQINPNTNDYYSVLVQILAFLKTELIIPYI